MVRERAPRTTWLAFVDVNVIAQVEFDTEQDPKNPDRQKACNVTGPGGAQVKGAPRQDNNEW